jgi:hypothetical protein
VSTTVSISGSGNVDVTVYGQGTVYAGNGNDSITITGPGQINVGSGNDTLTLGSGGVIHEYGASGHDTINIGSGNATIYEQGYATITGAFGSATISGGGIVAINQTGGGATTTAGSGHSSGSGSGHDTMISGSGHESTGGGSVHHVTTDHTPRQGGMERNLFATLANQVGSQHLIHNFVQGHPSVSVQGHTLSYLHPHSHISSQDGNTHVAMHGGLTTIELQGVHSIKATDAGKH